MKKKLVILLILLLPLTLLAGCESPRYRISAVQNTVYGTPAFQTIEQSIVQGAAKMGWQVLTSNQNIVYAAYYFDEEPYVDLNANPRTYDAGTVFANNAKFAQRALFVAIIYIEDAYRIEYQDSKNMGFDAESNSIYEEYHGLVKQLDRSIQSELLAAY